MVISLLRIEIRVIRSENSISIEKMASKLYVILMLRRPILEFILKETFIFIKE